MQPLSSSMSAQATHSESSRPRLFDTFLKKPFMIRLRHWEYWPFSVVYLPVFIYHLYLSVRARSLFFFSAANPSIETGGLLGESKADILDKIAPEFVPKTLFFLAHTQHDIVFDQIDKAGLTYPIMAKPNVGERGWQVEKIEHQEGLVNYIQHSPGDFLIQEYVSEPLELGVFYYRMPGPRSVGPRSVSQARGVVSSVVAKEFLSVRGNGRDTIEELIWQNERAILQLPALRAKHGSMFQTVLLPGETVELVAIGNHCKGTKFLDATNLITPELTAVFDHISQSIDGFYFGRYDLRCRSVADLYAGRHIRILELNGAGAEPAHIYQPGFSIWEAWRVLLHHWRILFDISRENHRRGVPYMTLREWRRVRQRIRDNRQ